MRAAMRRMAAGDSPLPYREANGNRVPAMGWPGSKYTHERLDAAINAYEWAKDDILMTSYVKCGTHFMWEVLMMLVRGKAEYTKLIQTQAKFDCFPADLIDQSIAQPRVLTTHYRLDCLPETFQNRKTIMIIRNPKDALTSLYHYERGRLITMRDRGLLDENMQNMLNEMSFSGFLTDVLADQDEEYGSFFDYVASMWKMKDEPNLHIVYFEELKRNPLQCVTKLNDFLGTNHSPELLAEIAKKSKFKNMQQAKVPDEKKLVDLVYMQGKHESVQDASSLEVKSTIYRKGDIGDWKNHFTVAENEAFDKIIAEWQKGKDIPFIYE